MKLIYVVTFTLIAIFPIHVFGQTEKAFFLGKRKVLTFGINVLDVFPDSTKNRVKRFDSFNTKRDWNLLPLEYEIQGQYALRNKFTLVSKLSFRGKQTSSIWFSDQGSGFGSSKLHTDSLIVKSSFVNFAIGFRNYAEYAPVGKYFQFDINFMRRYANVSSINRIDGYNNFSIQHSVFNWSAQHNYYGGSLALGTIIPMTSDLVLDVGFKSSVYLGKYDFSDNYDPVLTDSNSDFELLFTNTVNRLIFEHIRSSYILFFYVKLGIYS